ncbi:OLC1v1014580C1 [Oldenlandia corymbosa var. corymbosa]|uniref:OLC1v1014580C1 n=1 Tax=Oldenlandia corymbosa var. corymbosa TaxID=529605 RepID=A0AAV1E1T2_OLDCO|nr:OLC1v1014580C1 [Oldenlandia corymbosa var. corymbosa]
MGRKEEVDIEDEVHALLIDEGVKLLAPPNTVDRLLAILDDMEIILGSLGQDPSPSLRDALLPTKMGLVSDKLFRHPDMDVKASALSCIHELIRITAPESPYPSGTMKEIFCQTLVLFEKLISYSGRCYTKALHVLETVAKVRSCLILLEIGCDDLIYQMFQLLLNTIRSNHPDAVFSNMERIMTLLIEECDEISMPLLKPLLASVGKGNKNFSPISWRLGVKVLNNCSVRVKPYLIKAVEQMRQDIENHTDIVASIWPDATVVNVMKKAATESNNLVQNLSNGRAEKTGNFKSAIPDDDPSKALVIPGHFGPLQIIANKSIKPEPLESGATPSRRRGRRPNAMKTLDEVGKYSRVSGGTTSSKASPKRKNHGGTITKHSSTEKSSLQPKRVPIAQNSVRRCQPKKKVNMKSSRVKKEVHSLSDNEMKNERTAWNHDAERTPSGEQNGDNEYREELIGLRIKVFWPVDRQFYEGIVESYDYHTKKHEVVYFDGDVENLRLCRECWLLLDDIPAKMDIKEDIFPISSIMPVKLEKGEASSQRKAKQGKNGSRSIRKGNSSSSWRRWKPKAGPETREPFSTQEILAIKNEPYTGDEKEDAGIPPTRDEIIMYTRRPRQWSFG